jgi:protein-disulfide isomerase
MTDGNRRTRRTFLAALSTTPLLAGCLGTGSGGSESGMGTDSHSGDDGGTNDATETTAQSTAEAESTEASTATPDSNQSEASVATSHVAATDAGNEPTLGPAPGEGKATIIAYEDPSCPACQEFETGTFPELRKKLIEPGDLSFVYRTYPHVQSWAMPATQTLEAAYAHDPDAFWKLKAHFYEEQGSFSSDNVFSKVEAFLGAETNVDAAVVVEEAKNGEYDAAIQADEEVRKEAGVKYTPTFFMFRDGEYRTKAVGSQSYSVFKNSLGL